MLKSEARSSGNLPPNVQLFDFKPGPPAVGNESEMAIDKEGRVQGPKILSMDPAFSFSGFARGWGLSANLNTSVVYRSASTALQRITEKSSPITGFSLTRDTAERLSGPHE